MVTPIGEAAWRKLDQSSITRELDEETLRALSPILVLAPHPDDETLGCGGLLAVASRLGLAPRVVFLTDGGASHMGSPTWPRARLVQARRAEASAALFHLGVTADQTLFLEWPDANPHVRASLVHRLTLARIMKWSAKNPPRACFAPWWAEEHCDHRAASELADDLAVRLGARRLDYLVWGWTLSNVEPGHAEHLCWRLPCAQERTARRAALAEHRTQTTNLISDAKDAFLISPELAALTDRPSELFLERVWAHA